jgi:hypothetical protein
MKRPLWFAGVLGCALLAQGLARAQTDVASEVERVRLIQDQKRRELGKTEFLQVPSSGETQLDVGGWTTFTLLDFRDDDRSKRTPDAIERLALEDVRLYAKVAHKDGHKFYGRLRMLDFDFHTRPGVPEPFTKAQEGVEVDLAYVDIALSDDKRGYARVGRQVVFAGRGLVLASELDGGNLEFKSKKLDGRVFYGQTIDRDPDIDTSITGFDRGATKRDFWLGEMEYRVASGARYYTYLLVERQGGRSLAAAQNRVDFDYDTEYVGLGTTGRFDPLLHYYLEVVHQGGETMVDLAGGPRVSIDAAALVSGLLYYPEWDWKPQISLEYAVGTGDPARGSVTNTFGGKRTVSSDTNFNYFGVFDGGLALSPRLSNLHIFRLGYQAKPFPKGDRIVPGLLVGTKLSYYMKEEKDGVISDALAVRATHDVGFGADVFAGFRPVSDFSVFFQYGRFVPGDAYAPTASDTSNRMLLSSTLNF